MHSVAGERKIAPTAALEELAEAPPELGEDPRELLIRREQEEQFMKLVEQLPLPQRSVLLLHFVEDFSLEEIAGITGAATRHGQIAPALREARVEEITGGKSRMKTPRELLFERHRSAETKLDAVRESVVATVRSPQPAKPAATPKPHYTLRDLLLSCRWHLTAMSAAWLVVLVLNVDRSTGPTTQLARENRRAAAAAHGFAAGVSTAVDRVAGTAGRGTGAPPPRRSQFRPPWEVV